MKSSRKKTNGGVPVSAWCNGQLRKVGKLIEEDGKKVFIQRIKKQDILQIRGAAGVDLKYEPPLSGDCTIRHIVKDESGNETTYEIPLHILQSHPKTDVASIGPKHPKRQYLPYRYWKNVTQEKLQPRLFDLD
ncbi:hypothetical protein GFC01_00760 [Desulfofundulus thermobenzoicus]|uniref:Uncharacterized protein n=1 Tax=Desulfofundulus thermobenzoicus TaxID=29376 RepID=A0A6N7ILH3_9FIRM|nr:hypothetical protein [Desulfofundulus thermobenzoicus]MQL50830.1 hypothetical protein [Desulfofundulus thermobenzoicus]